MLCQHSAHARTKNSFRKQTNTRDPDPRNLNEQTNLQADSDSRNPSQNFSTIVPKTQTNKTTINLNSNIKLLNQQYLVTAWAHNQVKYEKQLAKDY